MFTNSVRFIHINKCAGTSIKKALNIKTGHQTLQSAVDSIKGENILETEFIFSFVRNPFDRMSSFYRFLKRSRLRNLEGISFEEWFTGCFIDKDPVFRYKEELFSPCYDWVSIEGEVQADFIGKVENIEIDFAKLCDIIGVNSIELPILNTTKNNNNEIYSDKMRSFMHTEFQKDFETWYPHLLPTN